MADPYKDPTYKRNRASILTGSPLCHWCGTAKATQADHLIELDRGGDHSLENLVPSCGPCNATRGTRYVNHKATQRIAARNHAIGATIVNRVLDEPNTHPEPLCRFPHGGVR